MKIPISKKIPSYLRRTTTLQKRVVLWNCTGGVYIEQFAKWKHHEEMNWQVLSDDTLFRKVSQNAKSPIY